MKPTVFTTTHKLDINVMDNGCVRIMDGPVYITLTQTDMKELMAKYIEAM